MTETTVKVINAMAEAQGVEDVWRLFVASLRPFGFERVNYGFTRYRIGDGIGAPEDAFFLSTHALARVKAFHESGLYIRTPEFRWVRENVGCCSWGYLRTQREAGALPASEVEAMGEIGARRERAGYTVSFGAGVPRSKGAMGLAAEAGVSQAEVDAAWAARGAEVYALCNMAHFKLSQMPLPVLRAPLTARQQEIVDWVADGKAMQDICVLTSLSMSAVEKHLRRVRDALAVETTAQAVAKLSFLNQLFVQG